MILRTIEDALIARARVAGGLRVDEIAGPAGSWHLDGGVLRHRGPDFFQIIARKLEGGTELLIRQREPALVGLVVTGPPGERRLLLNARAEPGLHGLCQFSTTIQSTPANYERQHGGRATPFLATVLGGADGSRVLHDSIQYDWGQYYDAKTKRVVIVEIPEPVPADEPLHWVEPDVLTALLAGDHLATTDLRVTAAALALLDREIAPHLSAPDDAPRHVPDDVPLTDLVATGTRSIAWVRTAATTREVDEWVQPLLAVADPLVTRLALRDGDRGPEGAVELATREGLAGGRLWYPSPTRGGEVVGALEVSAEGGRFLRHTVRLELVADAEVPDHSWRPLDELGALALSSRSTSVELRLLLGLAMLAENRSATP